LGTNEKNSQYFLVKDKAGDKFVIVLPFCVSVDEGSNVTIGGTVVNDKNLFLIQIISDDSEPLRRR
jgi:hypothetical protein